MNLSLDLRGLHPLDLGAREGAGRGSDRHCYFGRYKESGSAPSELRFSRAL